MVLSIKVGILLCQTSTGFGKLSKREQIRTVTLPILTRYRYRYETHHSHQCCGSGMFKPDPGPEFFNPGSRIRAKKIPDPDPHLRIKYSIFNPKTVLSSRKNDLGYSSRIRIFFSPSRIPVPGVKKAPTPGSGSLTLMYRMKRIPIRDIRRRTTGNCRIQRGQGYFFLFKLHGARPHCKIK
jgi:hypothetical protein